MSWASLSSSGPRSCRTPSSVAPSTYSIETSSRPSISMRSKIRQTLGETTSRAARTSCRSSSRPPLRLEEIIAERLEPDLDPELEVEGPPDLAHPAATEHLEDFVAITQHLANMEEAGALRKIDGRPLRLGAGGQRLVGRRSLTHVSVSILEPQARMLATTRAVICSSKLPACGAMG